MKKMLTLIAALSFLGCSGCSELISESNKKSLTVNEIADLLYSELSGYSDTIKINSQVDNEKISDAFDIIFSEHPEIFWVSGYTVRSNSFRSEITVDVIDNLSAPELETMQKELENAANAAVSSLYSGYDDYGRAVGIHDYLINTTQYDHTIISDESTGMWGTAYGCLVEKKAVCQGYAEAFQYLMQLMDMECGTVTGTAWEKNPSSAESHAWNYVKVNGSFYWVDVTWDDPDDDISVGSQLLHTYCLVDDERISRTHKLYADQKNIPECDNMTNNYFVHRGTYIKEYDKDKTVSIIAANLKNKETELMFSDEEVYETAVKKLFFEDDIWCVSDYTETGGNVIYSKDDNMYTVKIYFK